jgi:hypothetical protein
VQQVLEEDGIAPVSSAFFLLASQKVISRPLFKEVRPYLIQTSFLAYFPYFEKSKSRFMRSSCCLCAYLSVYPPTDSFRLREPVLTKLGM